MQFSIEQELQHLLLGGENRRTALILIPLPSFPLSTLAPSRKQTHFIPQRQQWRQTPPLASGLRCTIHRTSIIRCLQLLMAGQRRSEMSVLAKGRFPCSFHRFTG